MLSRIRFSGQGSPPTSARRSYHIRAWVGGDAAAASVAANLNRRSANWRVHIAPHWNVMLHAAGAESSPQPRRSSGHLSNSWHQIPSWFGDPQVGSTRLPRVATLRSVRGCGGHDPTASPDKGGQSGTWPMARWRHKTGLGRRPEELRRRRPRKTPWLTLPRTPSSCQRAPTVGYPKAIAPRRFSASASEHSEAGPLP